MSRRNIGKRKPRYTFILNPYSDVRVSKCPICNRPTHPRKFPLFISVGDWGPMVLGKTCRYCTKCELIIAHKDELEHELTIAFEKLDPKEIGSEYHVLGTLDRNAWTRGLEGGGGTLDEFLKYVADFKKVMDLKVEGGWGPA